MSGVYLSERDLLDLHGAGHALQAIAQRRDALGISIRNIRAASIRAQQALGRLEKVLAKLDLVNHGVNVCGGADCPDAAAIVEAGDCAVLEPLRVVAVTETLLEVRAVCADCDGSYFRSSHPSRAQS